MLELAKSLPPSQLAQKAYALYEKFRPEIPPGKKGRGPPANRTWTSSARWLQPDPEEHLLNCPDRYLIRQKGRNKGAESRLYLQTFMLLSIKELTVTNRNLYRLKSIKCLFNWGE